MKVLLAGMCRRLVWYKVTDGSKQRTTAILMVE
jgi:hypothetical protein